MSEQGSPVVDNPTELSSRFGDLSETDRYLLMVIAAATLAITAFSTLLVGVICGFVLLLPLYREKNGRLYRVFIRQQRSRLIRMRDNVIWVSKEARRRRFAPPRRSWKNPLKLIGIGSIGAMHYQKGGIDSVIITSSGSPATAGGIGEQIDSHYNWADAIKRAASVKGYAIGVSTIFSRRPANTVDYDERMDTTIHPDVSVPEGLIKDERELTPLERRCMALHLLSTELATVHDEKAGVVTMAVNLGVRRDRTLSEAVKRLGLTSRSANRLPLNQIAQNAMSGFRTYGLEDQTLLDVHGIEDFIREGWDINEIDDYRVEAAERRELEAAGTVVDEEAIHWPCREIRAFNDYCVLDGTFISVIRMQAGKKSLIVGEMRRLYMVDLPWVTITQVGEAVNSKSEYRMMNFMQNLWGDTKTALDISTRGPKAERVQRGRDSRLESIDDSGYSQSYNVLAAVFGTSHDELEDAVDTMLQHARYLGLDPERVSGEDYQLPAVWSAVYGVNML